MRTVETQRGPTPPPPRWGGSGLHEGFTPSNVSVHTWDTPFVVCSRGDTHHKRAPQARAFRRDGTRGGYYGYERLRGVAIDIKALLLTTSKIGKSHAGPTHRRRGPPRAHFPARPPHIHRATKAPVPRRVSPASWAARAGPFSRLRGHLLAQGGATTLFQAPYIVIFISMLRKAHQRRQPASAGGGLRRTQFAPPSPHQWGL